MHRIWMLIVGSNRASECARVLFVYFTHASSTFSTSNSRSTKVSGNRLKECACFGHRFLETKNCRMHRCSYKMHTYLEFTQLVRSQTKRIMHSTRPNADNRDNKAIKEHTMVSSAHLDKTCTIDMKPNEWLKSHGFR